MKYSLAISSVVAVFIFANSAASATSSHIVRGHVTKKGTYVPLHRATDPNKTKRDNWSQKGNVNPNTGKQGLKNGQ